MDRLVLVKHSLPEIRPEQPAPTWRLGDEGRERARLLALALAARGIAPALLATSPEPKAAETATMLAAVNAWPSPLVDAGLREHERAAVGWLDAGAVETAIGCLFARPAERVFGEETADEAMARCSAAVDSLLAARPSGDAVLVSHGTVIALFVARRTGCDPFPLWRRLGLPSAVLLSRPELALLDIVDEGRERARHPSPSGDKAPEARG